MIERPRLTRAVTDRLNSNPVVTLLGPRQCGKTTLARTFPEETVTDYFDLEDPADLNRLANPMLALEHLQGLIIIDEVQRQPDVFPILRVLVDRTDYDANFLLLGSASPHFVKGVSESLAGRVSFVEWLLISTAKYGMELNSPVHSEVQKQVPAAISIF